LRPLTVRADRIRRRSPAAAGAAEARVAPMGQLDAELWLPRRPEELFPFYADARNLERITPPWLRFRIVTPAPIAMQVGTLIDYRLRLHGVPLPWRSEITAWEPPRRFVDEQRRGPFRRWVHEHLLEDRDGGTRVRDRVTYEPPGGSVVDRLLVRRDLERIFAYRQDRLLELLGEPTATAPARMS
jgi:ligand-binding SRPBCC domain-containing protein